MKTFRILRFWLAWLVPVLVCSHTARPEPRCHSASAHITARARVVDPIGIISQPANYSPARPTSPTGGAEVDDDTQTLWLRLPRRGAVFVTVERDGRRLSQLSTDESMTIELDDTPYCGAGNRAVITMIFLEN